MSAAAATAAAAAAPSLATTEEEVALFALAEIETKLKELRHDQGFYQKNLREALNARQENQRAQRQAQAGGVTSEDVAFYSQLKDQGDAQIAAIEEHLAELEEKIQAELKGAASIQAMYGHGFTGLSTGYPTETPGTVISDDFSDEMDGVSSLSVDPKMW
jgi:DNA-binding transcriptional MerR regulator